MFNDLRLYTKGNVLDVGGWDFYKSAKKEKITFKHWTTLEYYPNRNPHIKDKNFEFVYGDGCNMKFKNNTFNTVLNIQVLEHVFEPLKMVSEAARVLRPGGYAIFLIPQTATIHRVPHHYYNFTKFWIEEAAKKTSLKIVHIKPLGGLWTTIASYFVYFFFQSIRFEGMSSPNIKRNLYFYLLFPLMAIFAIVAIPVCIAFSLGDLKEEPNNNLVVFKKV